MRKLPIVTIFGAGLSKPCGIADTAGLTANVVQLGTLLESTTTFRQFGTRSTEVQSDSETWHMTAMLWEALRAIYQHPTFENYVHALETLEPLAASRRAPNYYNDLDDYRPVATAFTEIVGRYEPFIRAGILRKERLDVIRRLLDQLDTSPERIAYNHAAQASRSALAVLVRRVRDLSDGTIITLNYDDLVDQVISASTDGFSEEVAPGVFQFTPATFVGSSDAAGGALLHLHGSVRFGYWRESEESPEVHIVKYADRNSALASVNRELERPDAARGDKMHGGLLYANTPIISGMQKGDKLMLAPVPFGYYYHAAIKEFLACSKALIVGYGGADAHLNSWLHEAAKLHGGDYRLVFVTYVPPAERGPYTNSARQIIANFLMPIEFDGNQWASGGADLVQFGRRLMVIRSGFPLDDEQMRAIEAFLAS